MAFTNKISNVTILVAFSRMARKASMFSRDLRSFSSSRIPSSAARLSSIMRGDRHSLASIAEPYPIVAIVVKSIHSTQSVSIIIGKCGKNCRNSGTSGLALPSPFALVCCAQNIHHFQCAIVHKVEYVSLQLDDPLSALIAILHEHPM